MSTSRDDEYSGQDYRRTETPRAAEQEFVRQVGADAPKTGPSDGRDIPSDNGQRAWIDQATGEVHGSGVGDGGGQEGEDFDTSSSSGQTYPVTGSENEAKRPHDLGPAHFKE